MLALCFHNVRQLRRVATSCVRLHLTKQRPMLHDKVLLSSRLRLLHKLQLPVTHHVVEAGTWSVACAVKGRSFLLDCTGPKASFAICLKACAKKLCFFVFNGSIVCARPEITLSSTVVNLSV